MLWFRNASCITCHYPGISTSKKIKLNYIIGERRIEKKIHQRHNKTLNIIPLVLHQKHNKTQITSLLIL